ncbi:tandem-95 repeat protein [Lutimonas saemankumensis]|uniref:Ig-like domain-containing protein n=1 Tax=Lutimonas saemankumensis TaxID=483016 RepID=UPI001CD3D726|nr:Ig-like domain-containing protein [Lutimonas saemankumensis]MCA0931254.1 tandem-95 repeat protein [Lutimonas saemankumensis]
MIKIIASSKFTFVFLLVFLQKVSLFDFYFLRDDQKGKSLIQSEVLFSLTTTSKNALWSPQKVVTEGEVLEWRASAQGMPDQVVLTSAEPVFDLSVSRDSFVTITVSRTDGEGKLKELILNSLNITSMKLENCRFLEILSCTDNQISSLDMSFNPELKDLYCHSNQLQSLNISKNRNLSILACFSNRIAELDVSQNEKLRTLSCSNNLLTNLVLTENKLLIALECDYNLLEDLNIKNGANTLIQKFSSTNNVNLTCIQVDDEAYSEANWTDIDPWTAFNKDCTFTNEPPIARDDFYELNENEPLEIDAESGVLSNDLDPDDDILIAILKEDVSNGILDLMPDGSFVYTPAAGFFGEDSFVYLANDGEFDSNPATVRLNVNMVNNAPIASDDFYEVNQNMILQVDISNGVLINDFDPDGDTLATRLESDVSHGVLDLRADGSFDYNPDSNFFGTDSFSYRAFDGYDFSNEARVKIEVIPVSEMEVPNAFTPNGDELNDTFRPVYIGFQTVYLQVFDTWGRSVYSESGSSLTGWDGSIKGVPAENGNYLYKIEAESNKQEIIKKEGIFTLIR